MRTPLVAVLMLVAAALSAIAVVVPIYPYEWEGGALAAQRDPDTAAAIVWTASCGIIALVSGEIASRKSAQNTWNTALRLARAVLGLVLLYRLVAAMPGYHG